MANNILPLADDGAPIKCYSLIFILVDILSFIYVILIKYIYCEDLTKHNKFLYIMYKNLYINYERKNFAKTIVETPHFRDLSTKDFFLWLVNFFLKFRPILRATTFPEPKNLTLGAVWEDESLFYTPKENSTKFVEFLCKISATSTSTIVEFSTPVVLLQRFYRNDRFLYWT